MSRTVRDVHSRQSPLARYRAERLLRTGFSGLRSKVVAIVRSRLRAEGISLDRAELDGCYAQAWHGLYAATLAGETIESPEAWLVLVTYRRAIDEARSASRAQLGGERDVGGAAAASASESDVAAAIDDRARLREVFEGLRARLSSREREAASLCYLQGLSRAEAAARMGIAERRLQKLMEGPGAGVPGVAGKVGELLDAIQAGGWCERQSSLVRAYAFGILDPGGERHALAVAHTRECPACRAHVLALRGLAAVLPPLPLLLPLRGADGPADAHPADARRADARPADARPAAAGPRGTGVRRLAGRALLRLAPARAPLPATLAVTGVALLGAGSAYLLRRPSPSPARAGTVRVAPASNEGLARATSRAPRERRGGRAGLAARSRSTAHRHPSSLGSSPVRTRAKAAAPVSPREFSPERVSGEASSPPPASPAPAAPAAPASSEPPAREGGSVAAREFGIE